MPTCSTWHETANWRRYHSFMATPLRCTFCLFLLTALPACGSGGNVSWGVEISKHTPLAMATMYHSAAVDATTADQVFQLLIDVNYNFASNLPVQVDRMAGRLTLRLGNDNKESIAEIIAEGEDNGAVSYFRGLAPYLSSNLGGQEVDIILCREDLADEFYTLKWQAEN